MDAAYRYYLTPAQLAKRLQVDPQRVREWIRADELNAINLAREGASRPRYRIPPEAVKDFERLHASRNAVATPKPKKRRKKRGSGPKDYHV